MYHLRGYSNSQSLFRMDSAMSDAGTEPWDKKVSWNFFRLKRSPCLDFISSRRSTMASEPMRYIMAAPGNIVFFTASAREAPADIPTRSL